MKKQAVAKWASDIILSAKEIKGIGVETEIPESFRRYVEDPTAFVEPSDSRVALGRYKITLSISFIPSRKTKIDLKIFKQHGASLNWVR